MGNYIIPSPQWYLNLSGGTVTGNTLFSANLSANTIFSAGTNLYDIFAPFGGGDITRVQSGVNIFTAGTANFPTINLTAATIDNLTVSGDTSLGSVTATTYYGDGSNLSGISTDNFYTTGATLSGNSIVFNRNDMQSAYTVDLTSILGSPDYSTNVSVTASTPDNYVGIGFPTITGYSSSVIYSINFTETNITTAVTINVDSVGALPLYVASEDGLVGPLSGSLTTGITYFMTYNGDSMQLQDTNPASTTVTYTNATPVPTTLGGIAAGMTFSSTTMQQMWDTLLYPYLNPSFATFSFKTGSTVQPQSLEIGNSVSAGEKIFTWTTSYSGNIQYNSVLIKNTNTGAIISTPSTGIPNSGSTTITIPAVTRTTYGSQTWTIYAKTVKNIWINKSFAVTWYNRIYYGNSSLSALTASNITGLTGTSLATTPSTTYTFAATTPGQYKYLCVPTALANVNLFRDVSTNLSVAMSDPTDGYAVIAGSYYVQNVIVTNAYGVNVTYKVYRTKNTMAGAIQIITT